MCGIAGFADFKNKSTREVVAAMAATMPHRGPDGQAVFFDQQQTFQVGLGHRRLSVIDLSHAADQPMAFEELVIVFNGEIYNYREIRAALEQKGHSFKTTSDTEVILHSWREWGPAAIHQWHGMFAIVMYDRKSNQLIAIRDRAGVKPLFYFYKEGLFLFASELKALVAHPLFKKDISSEAAALYMQFGYVPGPYTIYQHTHRLQGGCMLFLDLESGNIKTEQYWNVYDYYNKPKLKISLPEAIEETEKILEKAFQYRMVADVPVGVFLSGGFDSSCVTALLQKNSIEKIKTFTIGTHDNKLDEVPFARDIAGYLGTDHTEYYCTPEEALDIIPELPFYYDEPFADSSAIPTILVSRLAKKKVTVALSADAGDEIFAGYNRYDYVSRYGRKLRQIPRPLRSAVGGLMETVSSDKIPVLKNKPNFHSRYDKIKNLLADPSTPGLLRNLGIVYSDKDINRLFAAAPLLLPTAHSHTQLQPQFADTLSFMMAVDYQTYMADDILQKIDRATMSASLEGREPFLDQSVIEWAAQLPSGFKYYKGIKKYPLRQIVYRYLPPSLMDRPKMGFSIPVSNWLANTLRPMVETYLGKTQLQQHGLFNVEAVQKIKADFFSGRKEKYLKVWHLLMFQLWYNEWGR
ncbi:MAG: asparagine synthase (glutamine-hydrolyzing) [Niabella sp.]